MHVFSFDFSKCTIHFMTHINLFLYMFTLSEPTGRGRWFFQSKGLIMAQIIYCLQDYYAHILCKNACLSWHFEILLFFFFFLLISLFYAFQLFYEHLIIKQFKISRDLESDCKITILRSRRLYKQKQLICLPFF